MPPSWILLTSGSRHLKSKEHTVAEYFWVQIDEIKEGEWRIGKAVW